MGLRRRNLLLSAFVLAGMFSLLGMSCSIMTQPYTGPTDAPSLYVGGDSITNGAIDDINAQFQPAYRVRIEGWGGGDSDQMKTRVLAAAATAPDVAIIELGTNDPIPVHPMTLPQSEATLQAMYAAFPLSTCVIFVTPWAGTVERPPGSLAAIGGFERTTFPHVADWDAAVVPDDYAGTDNVHPNHTGNLHMVRLEAAAVASCPPPVRTTTTTSVESTTSTEDPSTTSTDDPSTTSTDDPTTTSTGDPTTTSTDDPTTTSTEDPSTTSTDDPTTTSTDPSATSTDPSTP